MKLFEAGYRDFQGFFVAENEEDAIKQAGEKLSIKALPVEAKEISEVDGYKVTLTKKK